MNDDKRRPVLVSSGPEGRRNAAAVRALGRRLAKVARIPREADAAKLALRCPDCFVARPEWLAELRAMAEGAEAEAEIAEAESRQEAGWNRWAETGSTR